MRWSWVVVAAACSAAPANTPPTEPSGPTWHRDADGDGFGDPTRTARAPDVPHGYVAIAGDCDDADPSSYPNALEVRDDGVDQDCDGYDATCSNRPAFASEIRLTGRHAHEELKRWCHDFTTVASVVVEDTSWQSLDPLACLCFIERLEVLDNPDLVDLSLLGRPGVLTGDAIRLEIRNVPGPATLDIHVQGTVEYLSLYQVDELESMTLHGLVEADRLGWGNLSRLQQLHGLDRLRSVEVLGYSLLPSMKALPELSSLEEGEMISVRHLDGLARIDGFPQLERVGTLALWIRDHSVGLDLPSITSIDELTLQNTADGDVTMLEGLPFRALEIQGWSIQTLHGLEGITELDALEVSGTSLTELGALSSLVRVPSALLIEDNGDLRSLHGLQNVEHVGDLVVQGNDTLTDVSALHGTTAGTWAVSGAALPPSALQALDQAIQANNAGP